MNPYFYIPQAGAEMPVLYANIGGPASRQRTQTISSTLLGKSSGYVRCRSVIRLGLIFQKGEDPVIVITELLKREGYSSPEALRSEFTLPAERLICRQLPLELRYGAGLEVNNSDSKEVLEQALLLGLCTAQLFDPARPVLWTEASLTRFLELCEPGGFYI